MYPFVRFREAEAVRERDEEDREADDPYDDNEEPEVVVRDDDPEVDPDTDADDLRRRFFASCRVAPLCSYLPLFVVFFLESVFFRGAALASRFGTSTGCVVRRIRTRGPANARDGGHTEMRGDDTLDQLWREKNGGGVRVRKGSTGRPSGGMRRCARGG